MLAVCVSRTFLCVGGVAEEGLTVKVNSFRVSLFPVSHVSREQNSKKRNARQRGVVFGEASSDARTVESVWSRDGLPLLSPTSSGTTKMDFWVNSDERANLLDL